MTRTIGIPLPDCQNRRQDAKNRRALLAGLPDQRGPDFTRSNGEETAYGRTYYATYHKALPHDFKGRVHGASLEAMVAALSEQNAGGMELLPLGLNRTGAGTDTDPICLTREGGDLKFRKLTSPMAGHVFETQGADAGAFVIAAAPLLDSPELAAEMAELYVMALLRDVTFDQIDLGTAPQIAPLITALGTMEWFSGGPSPMMPDQARRYESRGAIDAGTDLFRGSTKGSMEGPWMSQFMWIGSSNTKFTFERPDGTPSLPNDPDEPEFPSLRSEISLEDGFILYGTQVIDQRSIVAREGRDYMTNWEAWLDCQNGVDFNDLDRFRNRRRYLTTPRDIATYVHYDALYQGYLNAALLMLSDSKAFPKSRGLPETDSRTRAAFATYGGPHILTAVTEVATRSLKAVWRHKWLHHRRARPEVVAALLTLHENVPAAIEDSRTADALQCLRTQIPDAILAAVAAHNTAQNALSGAITRRATLPADVAGQLPVIADDKNYLLPMAFPEGSPTHPSYGAGHATVAGASVTILKSYFEMSDASGKPRCWPYKVYHAHQKPSEGGELRPVDPQPELTIEGELDKLAGNIAIARNIAGVHYYSDYYESLRLGERIAVSVIEEQLSMYNEHIVLTFTSFDGDRVQMRSNGSSARLAITDKDGHRVSPADWYGRYAD